MKHTYIRPQTSVTEVSVSHLIADTTMGVGKGEVQQRSSIGLVKGESSQSNYNVWEDDWSNE